MADPARLTVHGTRRNGYAWVACLPIARAPGRYHVDAGWARTRLGGWWAGRRALARLHADDRAG